MRREVDSFGEVFVPEEKYWGAQTHRSVECFAIGKEKIPLEIIHALAMLKKAAAKANHALDVLSAEKMHLITQAAEEVISGTFDDHFPLHVWQTGSGTHTNMNVNEVIANRAIELAKGVKGSKHPIHPNDDVNKSQSTNDVFPSAVNIAAALATVRHLIPALEELIQALREKEDLYKSIVKIGRTHLQDATPMTLGQEFSGYAALLDRSLERIRSSLEGLFHLAIGGTAVGTGINAPQGFSVRVCQEIQKMLNLPFKSHPNFFAALSAHDEVVSMSHSCCTLAGDLMKIANDIRWMGSGPRCGLGEIFLPENEPGSSIMPGKVNPTQAEALVMIATQVMGNDATMSISGALGNFELNIHRPLMGYNILQTLYLLADGMRVFTTHCVRGIKPNEEQLARNVENSLMLVTALVPLIGYDKAAKIAQYALREKISLKKACIELKLLSEAEFDRAVQLDKMIHPS